MRCNRLIFVLFFSFIIKSLSAQQGNADNIPQISVKQVEAISLHANGIEQKLDKKSNQLLAKLEKREMKMKRKLMKIDSLAANNIFSNTKSKYAALKQKAIEKSGRYIPKLDTLTTALKFLESNSPFLSKAKEAKGKLDAAVKSVKGLKEQFAKAEDIKQFIKERKQLLKDQLGQFGFAKELKRLNKDVYYYSQQVAQYKETLKDGKKIEKKALELLSNTKPFKDFMRKHSELASLFRMPGDNDANPTNMASLAGLQTRAQVSSLIQQQIAAGGSNAQQQFSQNLQAAQTQLSQLKDKLISKGASSSDDVMPEGFKPNEQKTKTFWQRLEYGTNVQTQKANGWFPVTSDLGLSVGYKLNEKSLIGIGASYKMGWGQNIQHIRISHQGVGLRSFVDVKVKGSFWMSGGYEQNYQAAINNIEQLSSMNAWQQSGLVGLSKTVSLKSKFFKKTKLQLLWDFLSYQQLPKTQPILFRVGYGIK